MATNLALDDGLIEKARRVGRHRSKKEAVTAALQEYVLHRKRLGILRLVGSIEYDEETHHKKLRRTRRR